MDTEKVNEKKDFKIIEGKVIKIKPTFVLVQFDSNKVGICHITNSSVDWVDDINKIFQVDQLYKFYLLEDKGDGHYSLSFKDPNVSRSGLKKQQKVETKN